MAFLRRTNNTAGAGGPKKPFYKKRSWRIFFLCLGLVGIFLAAFLSYIISTGAKVFDKGGLASTIISRVTGGDARGVIDKRVNIILMGRGGENHPGGLLTDSIMILSIDPKDKKIAMISIPRDLYVPIKNHGQDKINSAYADGYNDYMAKNCNKKNQSSCKDSALAAGANLTRETVSNVFNIPIQYYVTADFVGFKKFIDVIGGIDVNIDKAIYDSSYPAEDMVHYSPFKITAGQHHMDGALALQYARSRETTSDFDRSGRQQKVLVAVKDKIFQIGFLSNPKKIIDLVNIIGNHVRTDMTPSEIIALSNFLKDAKSNGIITKVLSTEAGGPLVGDSSSGTYYVMAKKSDFSELRDVANNIFVDTQNMEAEKAKIEIQNGASIAGFGLKLSDTLETYKLNVVSIKTAPKKSAKTTVYDYTGGTKELTVDFLEKGLNATVIQQKSTTAGVDILVVIGDDYIGFTKPQ